MLQKIKLHLEHQEKLIVDITADIGFAKDIVEKEKTEVNLLKTYEQLGYISKLVQEHLIIQIPKLLNPKEDYSFESIKKQIYQLKDTKEIEINEDQFNKYTIKLRELKKLYNKYKIQDIRNEHVAHYDRSRKKYELTWDQVFKVHTLICEVHDLTNLLLFGTQTGWEIVSNTLSKCTRDRLLLTEISKLLRSKYLNNEPTISREELSEILKSP